MSMAGCKHTPEARASMAECMRRRMADDAFRTQCGFLHDGERAQIVAACQSNRPYIDIAGDWLISESQVSRIATAAGVHRQWHKGPATMQRARPRSMGA